MEINNEYLPISEQDIDLNLDTQEYVDYLGYGVKEGWIDEDLAQEIIENGEWQKVREMMFQGEFVENSEGDI